MRRIFLLPINLLLLSGCAYTPKYALGPPSERISPIYNIRVGVSPAVNHRMTPMSDIFRGGRRRISVKAFGALLAKHLSNEKVFSSAELIPSKYAKLKGSSIKKLRTKGYDAILIVDVPSFGAMRKGTNVQTIGSGLLAFGPKLVGLPMQSIGANIPSSSSAFVNVELKIVETYDRTILWSGSESEVVSGVEATEGQLGKLLDDCMKLAVDKLVYRMEEAELKLTKQ